MIKLYNVTALIQGICSPFKGIWGLTDIDCLKVVTGPKTEIWPDKPVSVLIIVVSLVLLLQLLIKRHPLTTNILGALYTAGLVAIDFYYAGIGRISNIYMAGGILEVLFIIAWSILLLRLDRLTFHDHNH